MSTEENAARLAKLPKWAQQELASQEATIRHLRGRLAVGPEESNAFLDPYAEPPRPLGRNPVIEFGDRDQDHGNRDMTVRWKDGELIINGMAPSHDSYLAVFPVSGNQVMVKHVRKG